jgi:hypothetical protein
LSAFETRAFIQINLEGKILKHIALSMIYRCVIFVHIMMKYYANITLRANPLQHKRYCLTFPQLIINILYHWINIMLRKHKHSEKKGAKTLTKIPSSLSLQNKHIS